MVAAKQIRRRLYNEPVTAVQIGELARDVQEQFDALQAIPDATKSATPIGPADGDLAKTYPNPEVKAVHETSGPTKLTIGSIPDGQTLVRSGAAIIGSPGALPGGAAGGDLATTYPNPQVAAIHETSGPTKLTIGAIVDGEVLKRVGATLVSTASVPPSGAAGGDLSATYPNPNVAAIHEIGGPTRLSVGVVADNALLTRSGTTIVGTAVTGGIWMPNAAPAAPYADDNEFVDGAGSPAGWSVFDPLALGFTQAEIYPTFLKCSVPYNATNRLLASYRAAPAPAEYSIWAPFSATMVTGSSGGADDWDMSLVFMEGTTTLTKWAGVSLSYNNSIVARTWATYDAVPVNVGPVDPLYVQQVQFVRLGYDGTNFYFYISDDGITWNRIASIAKTFTPVKVGFAFTNSKNTGTKYALFDFYRVITGAGSSGTDILAAGRASTTAIGVPGAPNGPAGGDLSGSYPNPSVAAIHETGGATQLVIGSISDGQFVQRSGATLIGTTSPIRPATNDFRLTGVSGTPVMVMGATVDYSTIYLTPYIGQQIALYNGATWDLLNSSEISIAVSGRTTDLPFDIFAYNNAGTPTLELLDWTSATARATAIIQQDGVWCKTGALTRRWVGTCRARSATTFSWGTLAIPSKLDLFNADNRIRTPFTLLSPHASWTYASATVRQANASTAYQIDYMNGAVSLDANFEAILLVHCAGAYIFGFGMDSKTTFGSTELITQNNGSGGPLSCSIVWIPTLGTHYAAWLERCLNTSTCNAYGVTSGTLQSGMTGFWTC